MGWPFARDVYRRLALNESAFFSFKRKLYLVRLRLEEMIALENWWVREECNQHRTDPKSVIVL
jgi:hypothetical protein